MLKQNLLIVSRAYCEVKGVSQARISTLVFNDGKKLGRLERGADLSTSNYERAMAWFSDRWPSGAQWPEGIERPAQEAA